MTKEMMLSPRDKSNLFLATSLCDCIEDKNLDHLRILLKKNDADPNTCIPYYGTTPFHLVVADDSEDFAIAATKIFLQHGADPNVKSEFGETPIHLAAAMGRLEILRLLLYNGGEPLCLDNNGRSPFHFAFQNKHQPILTFLLQFCDEKNTVDDSAHYKRKLEKVLVNTGNFVAEYLPYEEQEISRYSTARCSVQSDSDNAKRKRDELMKNFDNGNEKIHGHKMSLLTSDRTSGSDFSLFTSDRTFDSNSETEKTRNKGSTLRPVEETANLLNSLRLSDKTKSWESLINLNISPHAKSSANQEHDTQCSTIVNLSVDSTLTQNSKETSNDSIMQEEMRNCSGQRFYLIDEEYKYYDNEENVQFLERRLCSSLREGSDTSSYYSCQMDKWYPLNSQKGPMDMPPYLLRQRLIEQGQNPGPITSTTYDIYLKRLYSLECRKTPKAVKEKPFDVEDLGKKLSAFTMRSTYFSSLNWLGDSAIFQKLEEEMMREFVRPDPEKKWREGNEKTSFVYLLLDPRILLGLSRRAVKLDEDEQWKIFLSAIFYVGKGKRTRPYAHLYDAYGVWKSSTKIPVREKKTQHILDIWNEGQGVVVLHIFQNVMAAEAFTREALMIEALSLENVDNCKGGEFYGLASTWPASTKRAVGRYLLHKCMQILMLEGERQLFPGDI